MAAAAEKPGLRGEAPQSVPRAGCGPASCKTELKGLAVGNPVTPAVGNPVKPAAGNLSSPPVAVVAAAAWAGSPAEGGHSRRKTA